MCRDYKYNDKSMNDVLSSKLSRIVTSYFIDMNYLYVNKLLGIQVS